MLDADYVLFIISAILPILASALLFYFDRKESNHLPYAARQVIVGIIFGILAILGTEWGIENDNLVVNCRDASVLSAGLLFGGPAGIIAGIIGGAQRYIIGFFGSGTYTQIACSLSTVFAGFFAAAIRRFPLDNHRPNWAVSFLSGLVMESIHMVAIVITHLNDVPNALDMVLVCTLPMFLVSFSVMLSSITVNIEARGGIKHVSQKQKSVRQAFQSRLLISFVIAFSLFSSLLFAAETIVCKTANYQYLEQNISHTKELNFYTVLDDSATSVSDTADFVEFGDTGYILISRINDGMIVSGPDSLCGKTMDELGIGQIAEINPAPYTAKAENCSYLYSASVNGTDCECMDSTKDSYRITAVYPTKEGYLDRDRSTIMALLIQIILFGVIFALSDIVIFRYVVKPIRKINISLGEIVDGKLNTKIDIQSNLEFAQLSDDINTTVNALKQYTLDAEKRMEEELKLAHTIQTSVLPKQFPPFPDRNEFDIFADMKTAKEVGGDFYDFYFINDNSLCVLVADASGKGIPGAMFMMRAKTLIMNLIKTGIALNQAIKKANEQLCKDNQSSMFITLWCGIIEVKTGFVTYVNAGHNSPLICHPDKTAEFIKDKHNFVLGVIPNISYTCNELQLNKDDVLYLYTDGVTEAMNAKHELFGNDRLVSSLSGRSFDSMKDLCNSVKNDVDGFVQNAPQADDITMLALRFYGDNQEDSLLIPATVDAIPEAVDYLKNKLSNNNADRTIIRKVSVILDELIGNISNYAYPDTKGTIEIHSSFQYVRRNNINLNILNLTVVDTGVPFNPLNQIIPRTNASINQRTEGGYGLLLIQKLMDGVDYQRQDNKNVLMMKLSFIPE